MPDRVLDHDEEIVEIDSGESDEIDPQAEQPKSRKLFTRPYDLTLKTLVDQIKGRTLHVHPLSEKTFFQRRYVWSDKLASRLVESILLNVPVPPCYLAQDDNFELEFIDGQQRIFSIYRFFENQFYLSNLEALKELNGRRYFELDNRNKNHLVSHTLRCVVITNDSDEELRFDVFERLNSNTMPINAQELRNCICRGHMMEELQTLAAYKPWLRILRRKDPDKRMKGEELVLRFLAFIYLRLNSYRTPQKYWLNDMARRAQSFTLIEVDKARDLWTSCIDKCLLTFHRMSASDAQALFDVSGL